MPKAKKTTKKVSRTEKREMKVRIVGGVKTLDVRLRFEGDQVDRILLAQEMTGISTPTQAVRYVLNRGFEALAPQIRQKAWLDEVERKLSPQELLPFIQEMERRMPPNAP